MATQPNDERLYPIAVLMRMAIATGDELRDDDVALKLNSIRRLSTIALALGELRTRQELLPYLFDSTPPEDELMVALAEEVGKMVPLVGGPAYADNLVPLLEKLAREEETVVRDAAVQSLSNVAASFTTDQALEHLVPCVRRLKGGEWFTTRVSACSLFAATYPPVSGDTAIAQELCSMFRDLCRDDTPMVRRAAASNIGSLAAAVDTRTAQQVLLPMLTHLLKDDQESVRKLALDSMSAFAKALASTEVAGDVLDAASAIIGDRSWRVRHAAASKTPALAEAFGPAVTESHLVKSFVSLLQDQEAEVRTAAAEAVVDFCEHAPLSKPAFMSEIMLPLKSLAADSNQSVRVALASRVLQLTPRCVHEDASTHVLDLILALLKDKVPDVRLNIITNLHHAQDALGSERLKASVVPAMEELAVDSHWRVRHAVIQQLPLLARQLGVDFYETKLLPRHCDWLCDPVAVIREAATKALIDVAEVFGESWTTAKAVPLVLRQLQEQFYLFRITCMQALPAMVEVASEEQLTQVILPALLARAEDPVPNVKFNVCKVLEKLAPKFDGPVVTNQVLPVLSMLSEDSDTDVQFFATQAMTCFTP